MSTQQETFKVSGGRNPEYKIVKKEETLPNIYQETLLSTGKNLSCIHYRE